MIPGCILYSNTNSLFTCATGRLCFDKLSTNGFCSAQLFAPFALSVARAKSKGERR